MSDSGRFFEFLFAVTAKQMREQHPEFDSEEDEAMLKEHLRRQMPVMMAKLAQEHQAIYDRLYDTCQLHPTERYGNERLPDVAALSEQPHLARDGQHRHGHHIPPRSAGGN